jgi:hypothetical protein
VSPATELVIGSDVSCTDGACGVLRSVVVAPLAQAELESAHSTKFIPGVGIPIGAVASVDNGIRLTLTKDDVRELPPIDLDTQTSTPHTS